MTLSDDVVFIYNFIGPWKPLVSLSIFSSLHHLIGSFLESHNLKQIKTFLFFISFRGVITTCEKVVSYSAHDYANYTSL